MNRVLAFLVLAILAAPMGALHFCQKETNKDGDALHVSRKVFRSAEKLNCGQTETLALIGLTSEFLTKGQALEGANAAQLEEKIAASTSALKGTLHKEECKESSVFSVKYSDLCESKLPSATEARLLCGDKKRFETLKDMSLVDVAVDFALESVGAEADDLKRAEGCEEGVSGQGGFLESSGTASLLTPRDTVSTVFLHRDGMALSERRGFTKTAVVSMAARSQAGHFSPQAVDKNDPYATRVKDQLLNGKDIQFEHVTVEPQDPHEAVSDPTTLAGLGGDHPDVLIKSVTFKTDWEETKGLVAHHFNEAMQGMLYDGTDPTRIDRLRTAISRSIKACGLTTITMNKNSTGCRKYRKMITTFLKKQLGGNVLDSLNSAFAPLGTDTLYEEDLFCLRGWLESQTVKDPWPAFLSAKESVFHFVCRGKPTDTPFPLWIHDIQKKYRAIGKMDLGDRRVDGVYVKNLAGNLQNKRVFYKMEENDVEITSLYVLVARAYGSVLRGEELKRLMDGRIMTEAELCALFAATFGMAFPDEKGGGGQQGKKDYVMITYDELQKLQQGHPNGGSSFGYRGRGENHQRGRGGRGRNFQRPKTPHRHYLSDESFPESNDESEEQEASTDERSTESEEREDWTQSAASSTDEEKKARRREFRHLYRIRQRKKKTFTAATTVTAAVQSNSDTDSLNSPFVSDPKVLMTEQLEDCGVNEEFVQKVLEGSWSSGKTIEDASKLSLVKDSGSTGVVTFSFGWLRMVQAFFPLADLGHWIWQPTKADPGPSWSTANGMVGVRGVWAGGFHLTDAAVLSARCVVLNTEDIVPPLIGMKFLEAWSARMDYGTKRMLLLHPGAKKQHLSIQ
uniref:Uncharacterized protein n=1 Tax=Chromera velia CCMP2878 TaxID=1169474 RepID=A0A0G4FUN8_9ALVE|eukprot:Cvel_18876.t1-p1 / transcript=Cvel_18876.t1 / gene=Cvel_18876 / organism=Chromera_velia_CCMP2878 / gene_product=hypothetical protein / transcript_product=hypothetical protein / location=Cvel_scaffold1589:20445-25864(-) / protein_length=850 / sequence_SO=supercontig / SO=protein_coding / is_pseudo=false